MRRTAFPLSLASALAALGAMAGGPAAAQYYQVGQPAYAAPPPVVYQQPAPVYAAPPGVVYQQPAPPPVVYQSAPPVVTAAPQTVVTTPSTVVTTQPTVVYPPAPYAYASAKPYRHHHHSYGQPYGRTTYYRSYDSSYDDVPTSYSRKSYSSDEGYDRSYYGGTTYYGGDSRSYGDYGYRPYRYSRYGYDYGRGYRSYDRPYGVTRYSGGAFLQSGGYANCGRTTYIPYGWTWYRGRDYRC